MREISPEPEVTSSKKKPVVHQFEPTQKDLPESVEARAKRLKQQRDRLLALKKRELDQQMRWSVARNKEISTILSQGIIDDLNKVWSSWNPLPSFRT